LNLWFIFQKKKQKKNRQYDCNLIVSLDTSPSRKLLADIVRNSTEFNCFVHTIEAWSGSFQGYIGPEEYKAKLLQSSFTLSPRFFFFWIFI